MAEAQGTKITSSKKSRNGMSERYSLLKKVGLAPPFQNSPLLKGTATDDLLDAAAASWTAHRIAKESAESVPDESEKVVKVCPNGIPGLIMR